MGLLFRYGFFRGGVYASQIRKLLRQYDYEKYLKTVRGIGYILTDDSELYG